MPSAPGQTSVSVSKYFAWHITAKFGISYSLHKQLATGMILHEKQAQELLPLIMLVIYILLN